MSLGGERGSVQNPLIRYAQEVGWEYVSSDDALVLRGGESGLVFAEVFASQLKLLNPGFMDDAKVKDLVKQLERIPPTLEGNLIMWEYLKGLKTVFVQKERRERNVKFIDAEDINANTYHVTDEFVFTNGSKTIRLDVAFLINGVPVFFVEAKAARKLDGISEALEQVKRYHRECPEILSILQVYALTHLIQYYYSATWNTSAKSLFNWKDESKGDYEALVKSFLDRKRSVKVLTDFILFTRQDDELKKVVLRPHQMRAVGKLVARAEDKERKRGLIWHTQGSGKTFTMIVAAKKIIEDPILQNPTVILLVDRNELESQLFGNLQAVGIENVSVAESKKDLKTLLKNDRRGLIVTLIHKFEGMPANINTRDNIFVMVDEAHRTMGGHLSNYLVGALPNATYLGFTGTPIDRTAYGKGTFIVFGKDDPPNGYLDKYSIAESIEDKTTVPLRYTLAPNELRVDKEVLEREFFAQAETEGISDITELNKVLEKAVTLRNMMKNRDRVENVAKYMVNHYKTNVEELGYKAFLVGVDREACALYKKELDKYLPENYSKVVYSGAQNDKELLQEYYLSEDEEKQVRKAFRKPDQLPKILIVTEKLLTGFDAPVLYCMYLDKPMRDHVLLQAIARVNRPYEDEKGIEKPSGFVLDFVGIFDKLEKALSFDSNDISGVVEDIELLKTRYRELMDEGKAKYLSIIAGKKQDKAVEAVLNHFMDEEERGEFYSFFNEIQDIYDIISPDAFLRPYIEDMKTYANMYNIIKESYESTIPIDREFSKKVAKLVQEYTTSGNIKGTLDVYEINEDTIKKLEEDNASDTEKVFNLIKSIEKMVTQNAHESPYLISIGERAEMVIERYKIRQISTQESLDEIRALIADINTARSEQEKMGIPAEIFSIFWLLKKDGVDRPEDKASQMKLVIDRYPHWAKSQKHETEVRMNLYKLLLHSNKDTSKITETVQHIMKVMKEAADGNT